MLSLVKIKIRESLCRISIRDNSAILFSAESEICLSFNDENLRAMIIARDSNGLDRVEFMRPSHVAPGEPATEASLPEPDDQTTRVAAGEGSEIDQQLPCDVGGLDLPAARQNVEPKADGSTGSDRALGSR